MENRTEMEMYNDPWDQMNCIQMRFDTISDYNDKKGEANLTLANRTEMECIKHA